LKREGIKINKDGGWKAAMLTDGRETTVNLTRGTEWGTESGKLAERGYQKKNSEDR